MKRLRSIFGIMIITSILLSACGGITIEFGNDESSTQEDQSTSNEDAGENVADPVVSESNYLLPKMILVDTGDEIGLTLFNLQGQPITELRTPGIGYAINNRAIMAGPIPEGPIMTPLVYHSFKNPESLLVNINDSIATIVNTPMFYGMTGAPGEDLISYSRFEPSNESVRSDLYIGNLETLPTAGPIYTLDINDNYYVINPMAIQSQDGVATGIWYTLSAWGIGGDIIYPVNKSLYFFDMTNGSNTQLFDDSCNPQNISIDNTWAACRSGSSDGSLGYSIKNLVTGETMTFPVDASSDRGAGYGAFSPDGTYIAWLEASGHHMAEVPNYHSRIRVGLTTGGIVFDMDDTTIAQSLGASAIPFMKPVGWLDAQTLLVDANLNDYSIEVLFTINITSGAINKLIDGAFVNFAYP